LKGKKNIIKNIFKLVGLTLIVGLLFVSVIFFSKRRKPTSKQLSPLQELGGVLFYDNNLSANGTKSCGSCHNPKFAFTDGYRKSTGIEADNLLRNAPSLINATLRKSLNWANPHITTLEQQMLKPLFTQHPKELGLDSTDKKFLKKFYSQDYKNLFVKAFGNLADSNLITYNNIVTAIAEYERTLISFNSVYDKYKKGKATISPSAMRGEELFNSEKFACAKCHIPPLFTDDLHHNIGLYKEYPTSDLGLYQVTKNENDIGKFKTPSLRNALVTPPYMHDGSVEKITDAIKHIGSSGKFYSDFNSSSPAIKKMENPQSKQISGFPRSGNNELLHQNQMSRTEIQDLINFLQTLTDTTFINEYEFYTSPEASGNKRSVGY